MSSSRNYGFDVYKVNCREKYKTQRFCVLVSIKYLKHLHIYINYLKIIMIKYSRFCNNENIVNNSKTEYENIIIVLKIKKKNKVSVYIFLT